MANPLSPELTKRVVYSKFLMKRAATLQAKGHEIALAEAILAAHDSVEMLMRVVTDKLELSPPEKFWQFWKIIKSAKGKEPPRRAAMDRLNHERVGFKHKGIPPNPASVNDLLRNAVAFCEEISREYLDLDYESVSLADLIRNAAASSKVKEAEDARESGDIPQALTALGIAFDLLMDEADKLQAGGLILKMDFRRWISSGNAPLLLRDTVTNISKSLDAVIDTVNLLILGVEPARLRRFSRSTPKRLRFADHHTESTWTCNPNALTSDDYDFCHSFVIDFGLLLLAS